MNFCPNVLQQKSTIFQLKLRKILKILENIIIVFHSMAKLQQNESSIATVDKNLTVVAHEFHQLTPAL